MVLWFMVFVSWWVSWGQWMSMPPFTSSVMPVQ
jgi:hypothetical protein